MKKLLFVAGSLRVGGIERSLSNLLKNLNYQECKVDLFLYSNSGEYKNDIPEQVQLINNNRVLNALGLTMVEAKKTRNPFIILTRMLAAVICRFLGSDKFWKVIFKTVPKLSGYDVAIAFSNNVNNKSLYSGFYQFILERVNAGIKIGWVHSDYKAMGIDPEFDRPYFEKLDKIVNVSFASKKVFDNVFTEFKSKSFVVYNSLDMENVVSLSSDEISAPVIKSYARLTGVTVARLDQNKSVDRVINSIGKLRKKGIEVNWIIVGDGPERLNLERLGEEWGILDSIYFTGMVQNPYPYIRMADVLVLCSRYEGMPMTIAESLTIGTPVLVTQYGSAEEQIINGLNGIIIENSEKSLYNALIELINKPVLLNEMRKRLIDFEGNNKIALDQFYSVIND